VLKSFLATICFSIAIFAPLALSQNLIRDDFRVNSDTVNLSHESPDIDVDTSGAFAVVWQVVESNDYDVWAQRFDSQGEFLAKDFLVNNQPLKNQKNPSIAKMSSGKFLIVWQDLRNANYDIYGQLYECSGDTVGTNFKMNDDPGTSSQQEPKCDIVSGYAVCWMDKREGDEDIFMQLYDSLGNKVNSNIKVNDDLDSIQRRPSVSMSASGYLVIVWQDKRDGDYDIYAQRFDSSGNFLGNNFKINDDTLSSYQGFPEVDSDKDGNFVVVWQDTREGYYDIYAQYCNESGERAGANFKVNDDSGNCYQGHPDVAMSSQGSVIIVWEDKRNGDSDIYAQRYDSKGEPQGENYRVNSDSGSFEQEEPRVGTDGQRICFVWQDNRLGRNDIFGKVVRWSWTFVEEEGEVGGVPGDFVLYQNYPNPFNPTTTISFTVHGERRTENGSITTTPKSVYGSQFVVHSPIHTTLTVYNILGQRVKTLVSEKKTPGYYQVIWDGKDEKEKEVATGIYFYRLRSKGCLLTKKMLLLR